MQRSDAAVAAQVQTPPNGRVTSCSSRLWSWQILAGACGWTIIAQDRFVGAVLSLRFFPVSFLVLDRVTRQLRAAHQRAAIKTLRNRAQGNTARIYKALRQRMPRMILTNSLTRTAVLKTLRGEGYPRNKRSTLAFEGVTAKIR